jgi:PAS domain S-box-containing protein
VKLTPRLTLIFILYAMALLIGVGFLAYSSGRDSLRTATISELQATALEKEAALNRWIEERQTDIVRLASDPTSIEAATDLMAAFPGSPEAKTAHDRLIETIQPNIANGEFLEVSLLHPQTGQVIISTDPGEEGKFKENRPYFLNAKTGPFVQNPYYSFSQQSIAMTASAPLHTPDGQLLGVLAARLDLEGMNTIISRYTDLRETSDAYLANASRLFVTQPRFIDNPVVLQRGVDTQAIDRCLDQESGVIEAVDYRQVPAFVVYRWLPERGLCLVVKLDRPEAYRPIRAFGARIVGISAVALLFAAGLALALSRSLTQPILALQSGAARFARGELSIRLAESPRDELGELAGEFNKMAEALTEQQTHLRRRAEQFFNLTLDLLCTIDPAGRLVDLNPAWERILGYQRKELTGSSLTDLIHPGDRTLFDDAFQRLIKESGTSRFECRCRHKEGHYRWLAWSVVMSPDDQLLYVAARDTTERRSTEEKLRQQTEELEHSNRELEQFAYVASHDLQEPLRIVSSYVQLLARRYQGKLDQDADVFISYAVDGANRMKSLITDLLAYSRVGTRDKEFAPVAMEEIYKRVIDDLQLAITDTGATVTHDPLPVVLGDHAQMTQLLQNLIGNAIKFHGKEPPRVHVGVRQQGGHWLFFVRDNGIGIDPQHTERVFVIFQRLHKRDEYAGTGIGLAICRKIVERHGGRIWIESEPGKGSTFYFTLQPAEDWSAEAASPGIAKARPKDAVADRATDLI